MKKVDKFATIKSILDAEIEGEIDLPSYSLIFALTDKELSKIMTKKRLELIRVIDTKHPKTIKELADYTDRKLPAVDRDIKLLVQQEIVKTKRTKRGVQPILNKGIIILPLTEKIKPRDLKLLAAKQTPLEANIYVDGKNINQEVAP